MTIAEYLAALRRSLRVGPLAKRRILREIEAHLLDAADHEELAGIDRGEAERAAVERLGPADLVAARFSSAPLPWFGAGIALGAAVTAVVGAIFVSVKGAPTISLKRSAITFTDSAGSSREGSATSTITYRVNSGQITRGSSVVRVPGVSGRTLTFTYTGPSGGFNQGVVEIAVPPGWLSARSSLLRFVRAVH